ncbi:MAG: M1 family metallopeptidase [Planctomycetota bacterium]
MKMPSPLTVALAFLVSAPAALGQIADNDKYGQEDHFRQLDELLPSPNSYRTASGAPGHEYWQQQVDYEIEARLDDERQRLVGTQLVSYHNNSPDTLRYLWVQLDRNYFAPFAEGHQNNTQGDLDRMSFGQLRRMLAFEEFDGSYKISRVELENGTPLEHTVIGTMMRIELPKPLGSGDRVDFHIDWSFNINDSRVFNSRTAGEYFEEDGNWLYLMAHWYPRMAAYTDYAGWQHKQFLGRGEFTLEFGDYDVKFDVPDDHIVASTGVLQNPEDVLEKKHMERLEIAAESDTPVFIVTPDEAKENQETPATGRKVWHFKAEDVRDFAFASSRRFIWDAQGYQNGDTDTMAMSYYPNEGEPLWSKYSTHAVIHTIETANKFAFDYPYPVAISVNGPVGGMEYPMICFNGPRPAEDGTYSARNKYGLISVIIHEVIHFYFPMIVNSDERQWTWMDEGVTTFLQFLCEQEWEDGYPSRRGAPENIVPFMTSSNQRPIMTNSESTIQFGANAYAKPATALNILRETVMGREQFDYAFREYARRWKFKRPEPADMFRTFEDASGMDLDWFFRGWFYTTDHVDISVTNVHQYTIDTQNPAVEKGIQKRDREERGPHLSERRNEELVKRTDRFPELLDFYNDYDPLDVTYQDRQRYDRLLEKLSDENADLLEVDLNFYHIELENVGGLVMPVILELHYTDGSRELKRYPATVWVQNGESIGLLVHTPKTLERVFLDPLRETADADEDNNHWPRRIGESRFELFERGPWGGSGPNPMQEAREAEDARRNP